MIGRTIGSYRVVRKIGAGGMGTVFEAVHTTLGRRAAIKTLQRSTLTDPTAAARFFNEAKAIGMVSHPCLVTIYEHGTYTPAEGATPEAYIAMEYIEGESLRARLEKRYLGGSAVGLVRQLASALAVAHKQRIIHRDLKPDNIMLVADDTVVGGVRAKILDFGLAKLLPQPGEADAEEDPSLVEGGPRSLRAVKTRTGVLIGTPMYMSPEQCHGEATDDKTDVYSLGVIFFELLFGDPPFVSRSAGELYAMHLFIPPPELTELLPGLPPELAALVHRMLDKKPANRPSMEQLLGELQALPASGLGDGPAESRPSDVRAASAKTTDHEVVSQMRRKLQRLAEDERSLLRSPVPAQISAAASRGEQVAAQRPAPSLGKMITWAAVAMLASALLALGVRMHRAAPSVPAAPVVSAPPPPVVPPPPSAQPPVEAPAEPAKKPPLAAAASAAKDKPSRKSTNSSGNANVNGNGAKKPKGGYDVTLWK